MRILIDHTHTPSNALRLDPMRYTCMKFPGLYGNPWSTDSWLRVRLWVLYNMFCVFTIRELRVVDTRTGKHYVW